MHHYSTCTGNLSRDIVSHNHHYTPFTITTCNSATTSMSTNKAEQAVAYAALILADEFIAITPEKLQTLLKAAGVDDIEPIWTALFAKALEGKNVKDILTTVVPAGRTGDEAPTQKSNEASDVDSDKGKVGGDAEDGSDGDSDIGMSLFD